VAAAAMPGGEPAVAVATAGLVERLGESALGAFRGQPFVAIERRETQGGRERTEGIKRHDGVSG
jgi:hypothetical protein